MEVLILRSLAREGLGGLERVAAWEYLDAVSVGGVGKSACSFLHDLD